MRACRSGPEAPVPLRSINLSIPKDFANAVMRCLSKDPWARFVAVLIGILAGQLLR